MFYEMAESGKEPTAFQLARLRSYEVTSRLNNIIFEAVDFGTDIAFILVLFDQAKLIVLPNAWQFYKATSRCAGLAPGGPDLQFYRDLAIASSFFLGASILYRLCIALGTIFTKSSEIEGLNEWLWVLAGMVISVIDPWNGTLMMNQVFEKKRIDRDDYILAKSELKSDAALLLMENVPQLIIQIIYGVNTGQANYRATAWYLAIFITVLHMASQLSEFALLAYKLPELFIAYRQGYGELPDEESGAIVTMKQ